MRPKVRLYMEEIVIGLAILPLAVCQRTIRPIPSAWPWGIEKRPWWVKGPIDAVVNWMGMYHFSS